MAIEKAVIIGGTSGIGLAAARRLREKGLEVIAAGRDAERAAKAAEENPGLTVARVDATSGTQIEAFFRSHAVIDHLILSVTGTKGAGKLNQLSVEELREGFELKFFAQFQAAQLAIPFLQPRGSLTFVSAISARAAHAGTAGLAAINGAIEAMVKPLARELAPLRVNAVSPGVVETPWWDRLAPEMRRKLLTESAAATLVGRNGTADDLADAIAFLTGNSFVTGTILEVDGGLRLS